MVKKLFFFFLISTFLLVSCSIFQKESFTGKWEITLAGDHVQTFKFEVKDDLTFSFSDVVSVQGSEMPVEVKGNISEDGKVTAVIFTGGQDIGSINGTFTFTDGKGSWQGGNLGGTWTGAKE